MDKKRKPIELVKDVLIVLLAVSAVWLALQSRLIADPAQDRQPGRTGQLPGQSTGRTDTVHPLRISANQVGSSHSGRYAVQYDGQSVDALFQQSAGLLAEALSSMEEPEKVTRRQWESALTELPGLCFDFQGQLPLEMLSGWLSGQNGLIRADVRRLILAVRREQVVLYYRDERNGSYFRCPTQTVNPEQLDDILLTLTDNGAFYAFESDWCGEMDPDTLLQPEMPTPTVYTVTNPMGSGQASLEELMDTLGFSQSGSSFYSSGDELVVRNGTDMLRLSDKGMARYESDLAESRTLSGQSRDLLSAVETCRRIAAQTLGPRSGAAGLYLQRVEKLSEDKLEITFGYSLDSIPVNTRSGWCARFAVEAGNIVRFDLQFRHYQDSGSVTHVLPPRQAAAALGAMEAEGGELMLVYSETGSDAVQADWAAAGLAAEGE